MRSKLRLGIGGFQPPELGKTDRESCAELLTSTHRKQVSQSLAAHTLACAACLCCAANFQLGTLAGCRLNLGLQHGPLVVAEVHPLEVVTTEQRLPVIDVLAMLFGEFPCELVSGLTLDA